MKKFLFLFAALVIGLGGWWTYNNAEIIIPPDYIRSYDSIYVSGNCPTQKLKNTLIHKSGAITRGEWAHLLVRTTQTCYQQSLQNTLKDVPKGHKYKEEIETTLFYNFLRTKEPSQFLPEQFIDHYDLLLSLGKAYNQTLNIENYKNAENVKQALIAKEIWPKSLYDEPLSSKISAENAKMILQKIEENINKNNNE